MIDWDEYVGKPVVVDYKASNEKIAYARGILEGFEDGMLCVKGETRFWLVAVETVIVCRVTNDHKGYDDRSYRGGDFE